MTLTLTGDDNFSGYYTDIFVLGAAIGGNSGGTYTDTNAFDGGNETFMFGDLQHKSTVISTEMDETTGTYQSTATGTGGSEVDFHFTLATSTTTETSDFLHGHDISVDADGSSDPFGTGATGPYYETSADVQSYYSWLADHSATDGWVLTNQASIEFGADQQDGTVGQKIDDDSNPNNFLANIDTNATKNDTTVTGLTADDTGNKILLGFTVDPTAGDHIGLNVDKATFEQYFTVNADTHISANNNVVNDTVISLGSFTANTGTAAGDHVYGTSEGNWSVDLYGVSVASLQTAAANAGYQGTNALSDYVYDTIVHHT